MGLFKFFNYTVSNVEATNSYNMDRLFSVMDSYAHRRRLQWPISVYYQTRYSPEKTEGNNEIAQSREPVL
jgi:hypothetical protein